MLSRRTLLTVGGAGLSLSFAPRIAFARAATDRRFVFILQRGAADGLGTVAPIGDPAFSGVRGAFAQDFASGAKLDAMFALHPAMPNVAAMYKAGEALFVHAVASPYRDRSHFDAQNVIESGGASAYSLKDGWMNRLLGLLPKEEARAIAVSATVPLALRGRVEVASYADSALPGASGDLMSRVGSLYAEDPQLLAAWEQATATRAMVGDAASEGKRDAAAGAVAARLLKPDNGARIAMLSLSGWDTHAQQRIRLQLQLASFDAMIGALHDGLGPLWSDTLVVVATEFGRTVRVNGTGGTDHGTGSVAMLLGGAVKGGRVVADWPGLSDRALLDGRDLRPTTALDTLFTSAVSQHFALDPALAMKTLFPQSQPSRPIEGLLKA